MESRQAHVLRPDSPGWDDARQAWNLALDQQPEAIVVAESTEDVIGAVEYALQNGLRVAAQATGHGAKALGPLAGTLLIRTRMHGVEIDAEARRVRVEAGTPWREILQAAGRHGLAGLAGSAPDVGVVGYSISGGLSFLGRKYGLAAHSIGAAEVVTADGRLVHANEESSTELLWALRGGGGNFGAVTALELELVPLSEVYAGILWFPLERAAEVLHAWAEMTRDGLPDELTTIGRLLQLPPLPEIPEPVRGKSFAVVEAIHCGAGAEADALLQPLRALRPAMDTMGPVPIPDLGRLHMDPDHPVPAVGDGTALETLPTDAIDELVRTAGPGSGSPLLSVEVRQLGGALGQPRPDHAALAAAPGEYALYAVGIAATPEIASANEAQIGRLKEAMLPWTTPGIVANFAETRRDPTSLWGEDAVARLRKLKEEIDPGNVFRSNHPLLVETAR
ncbi:MAG: FAD-binding oxidoreductase [Verrucomicrobiota bacterium]